MLVEAGVELPARAVRGPDLDRAALGDRAAGEPDRAGPAARTSRGAFEQVGGRDAAVSAVAEQLGVAWWTVMDQVIDRGMPAIDDSARLAPADRPTTGSNAAIATVAIILRIRPPWDSQATGDAQRSQVFPVVVRR